MGRRKSNQNSVEDIFFDEGIVEEDLAPIEEEDGEDRDISDINWVYTGEENKLPNLSPELRLRLAILGDAIMCLQRDPEDCNREAKMDHEHAKQWFEGEIESEPTCSFEEICDLLGLDPSAAKAACLKIAESGNFDIRELVFWLR